MKVDEGFYGEVVEALRDLHAEVEMGEAVGICLPDRVPSLRARDLLAAFDQARSVSPLRVVKKEERG